MGHPPDWKCGLTIWHQSRIRIDSIGACQDLNGLWCATTLEVHLLNALIDSRTLPSPKFGLGHQKTFTNLENERPVRDQGTLYVPEFWTLVAVALASDADCESDVV